MALNLEKQLLFYGAYHHNPVNVAIHIIFVPTILVTAILLGTNTPSLLPSPEWMTTSYLPLNLGTIACFLYSTLYIIMEPVAGFSFGSLLVAATAYCNYLNIDHSKTVNIWATVLQISAWLAQFVGHGKFEGRAPALLDNLVQALFLAPLFVWLEVLFSFGYRPELKARLDAGVEKEIEKFRAQKGSNGKAKY